MTRNEILKVAGEFYKPETITEREVAFARHMMKYEREQCAKVCYELPWKDMTQIPSNLAFAAAIRARGEA
jgi:uncharacterized FlgJ-related protein